MRNFDRLRLAAYASVTTLAAFTPGCITEQVQDQESQEQGAVVPPTGEDLGTLSQAIASEIPGEVEIADGMRLNNPDRLRTSLATAKVNPGCSATMIGPNLLMTAAHCGKTTAVRFIQYNSEVDNAPIFEVFTCTSILSAFPETDLQLAYCDPNAAGEHPGIKYGYADFDLAFSGKTVDWAASRAKVIVGSHVYSTWWNPVDDLGDANHLLYSVGTIGAVNISGWYNPSPIDTSDAHWGQCGVGDDAGDLKLGAQINIYSQAGCSGSAVFNANSYRIIAGPTSTATSPGSRRNMLPIVEYLSRAVIQSPDTASCGSDTRSAMINGTVLQDRWGLTASNFRGVVDANSTGVFDIQESIERVEGEHQRSAYFFDFASARNNQMWNTSGAINTQYQAAQIAIFAPGWLMQAVHPRMNLKPNTSYHVSYLAASSRAHAVCLGNSCSIVSAATPSGTASYTRYSAVLNSGSELRLWTSGEGYTWIDDIAIVEMNTTDGFSTADARRAWSASGYPNTSTPNVIPLGKNSSTEVDFAGVVRGGLYSLWNSSLPFKVGRQRVCFDMRNNPLHPTFSSQRVRIRDNGVQRVNVFLPTANNVWNTFCTAAFDMQTTNGILEFGIDNGGAGGSFLVDNIKIEPQ